MAKVIRSRYVFRPHNRWHRFLPLRNDGVKQYDYEAANAIPEAFPDPIPDPPSKLWLAWIYREPSGSQKWIRQSLETLFGKNCSPGKMHIFKNTSAYNRELWMVKHLIELRPLTFPDGEPTEDDIGHIEIHPDGRCTINKELFVTTEPGSLKIMDEQKQFTSSQLTSKLQKRYATFKDVYEDTVYNPKNISIVD